MSKKGKPLSHPSRVRGLKLGCLSYAIPFALVAPFTGAWIEIVMTQKLSVTTIQSHPSRVRGLKFYSLYVYFSIHFVAPFTGAWIEILEPLQS